MNAGRHTQQVLFSKFITGVEVTKLKNAVRRRFRVRFQQMTVIFAIQFAFNVGSGIRLIVIPRTIVCRNHEFAKLCHSHQRPHFATITNRSICRHGIARRRSLGVGYDIKHTSHPLGIIFCARIGNNLYLLNSRSRISFEYHRRIGTHHLVGLAVNIHLKAGISVHLDVILTINRHHRHLAQHFKHSVGFSIRVIGYRIRQFVQFGLNQWALCRHGCYP